MVIKNQVFEEERALYGVKDISLEGCAFRGALDGESALKETRGVCAAECEFALRYPLWHAEDVTLTRITMTETCRAPLWYDTNITLKDSALLGPKAVRECHAVGIEGCNIRSEEFGWFSSDLKIKDTELAGMYAFLHAENIEAEGLTFSGKYSFQYVKNATFRNCVFKTKDAFWHAQNVTVYDSVMEGEYLGWYAEGLTLVRCHIKGTQPLCYAKDLRLEDCTMEMCDLSFEKSSVTASVRGHIDSIKAPASGRIEADSVGEILPENDGSAGGALIVVRNTVSF